MQKKHLLLVFITIFLIHLSGIQIPVMDIDAAQYASMSRQMMERKVYLQVFDGASEYLDKPPFLFWVNVAAMKIFGANNFAYRLPSILFALLAIYSTYKFALLYYNKIIAQIAAIVLASSQAMFLITHDVRTDTILMGWVILSVWQLGEWYKNKRWVNFVIAFAAIGGGMMTKGPIALLVPVFGFGAHFLMQKNFRAIFKWQYILGLIIIALVLLPMSIGLYQQFDLHPEKIVNGKQGVSGLRFFYWTQSFGRITGESTWDNNAGFLFLMQNMLWAFLPWIFLFLASLLAVTKRIMKNKFAVPHNDELITFFGFIITYISLAISHYQLPHYIFVVLPFAAIITSKYIYQLCWVNYGSKIYKGFFISHAVIYFLLFIGANILVWLVFAGSNLIFKVFISAATLFFIYLTFTKKTWKPKLFALALFTICAVNIILNNAFYPALLQYQSGNIAAKFINANNKSGDKVIIFDKDNFGHAFRFYTTRQAPLLTNANEIATGNWVITSLDGKLKLDSLQKVYKTLYTGQHFPVSRLNLKFINPSTRNTQVQSYYILQMIN